MTSKTPFFLTRSEAFRFAWLLNFATKLPNYSTLFGIPQDWVDEIVASKTLLEQILKYLDTLTYTAKKVRTFKDALFNQDPANPTVPVELEAFSIILAADKSSLPNIFKRAIAVAEMILANPLCSDIIKEDLKLVKPTQTEAIEASGNPHRSLVEDAPVIKAKVSGDTIKLTIMRGKTFRDLMAKVYVSRTDRDAMTYLTSTNTSTVTDRATFAEGVQFVTYTYQVQMMNGDTVVGDASKPLIVVVPKPLGLANAA